MSDKMAAGLPCEPCMMVRIFGKPSDEHPCTGSAALLVEAPCPCCGPTPMPKFCGRCDQPIRKDEPRFEAPVDQSTGPGSTVVLHARLCDRAPVQSAPEPIRH